MSATVQANISPLFWFIKKTFFEWFVYFIIKRFKWVSFICLHTLFLLFLNHNINIFRMDKMQFDYLKLQHMSWSFKPEKTSTKTRAHFIQWD